MGGNVVVIGEAKAVDAQALAAVHATGFAEAWSVDALRRLLAATASLTLKASDPAGTIVGFVLGFVAADEAEVLTIVVVPEARRRGVARQLISAFADAARRAGAHRIYLDVAQSNHGARRLYEGLGYLETGRRKGYYRRQDGEEDAVVLALTLGEATATRH